MKMLFRNGSTAAALLTALMCATALSARAESDADRLTREWREKSETVIASARGLAASMAGKPATAKEMEAEYDRRARSQSVDQLNAWLLSAVAKAAPGERIVNGPTFSRTEDWVVPGGGGGIYDFSSEKDSYHVYTDIYMAKTEKHTCMIFVSRSRRTASASCLP